MSLLLLRKGKLPMAQQKKKGKKSGFSGGKPYGMNHVQMLQWMEDLKRRTEELAKSELQMVLRDRQAQRTVWLYIIALNEKFGFGAKRTEELEAAVKELTDEYKRMVDENDQDYADEQLRHRVSEVRGHEVKYLYEDQYPVNTDRKEGDVGEEHFAALRESESRIY